MLLAGLLWSCATPTTDTDQVARNLLQEKTWISDTTNFTDAISLTVYLRSNGTAVFNGDGSTGGAWSYKNGSFHISGGGYTSGVTLKPDLTSAHFYFNCGGGLCHLVRL